MNTSFLQHFTTPNTKDIQPVSTSNPKKTILPFTPNAKITSVVNLNSIVESKIAAAGSKGLSGTFCETKQKDETECQYSEKTRLRIELLRNRSSNNNINKNVEEYKQHPVFHSPYPISWTPEQASSDKSLGNGSSKSNKSIIEMTPSEKERFIKHKERVEILKSRK